MPSRPQKSSRLAAATPTRELFDPWNSASTGHQRAENRLSGSTSWRDSRTLKLSHQFCDSSGSGGDRVADLVGAGSENCGVDGRLKNSDWEEGASGPREKGWQDIRDLMGGSRKKRADRSSLLRSDGLAVKENEDGTSISDLTKFLPVPEKAYQPRGIFSNLTIYVNGSTAPLVSDHRLKQLLSHHGANLSIALGRKTVTHVILGRPNAKDGGEGKGAGGGLAARKIQKEIELVRGKGVKFVGVEWVLESIKAGIRLPESRFTTLHLAPKNQKSVYQLLSKQVGAGSSWSICDDGRSGNDKQGSNSACDLTSPCPSTETDAITTTVGTGLEREKR